MERILTFVVCIAVVVALLAGGVYTVSKVRDGVVKKIEAAMVGRGQ